MWISSLICNPLSGGSEQHGGDPAAPGWILWQPGFLLWFAHSLVHFSLHRSTVIRRFEGNKFWALLSLPPRAHRHGFVRAESYLNVQKVKASVRLVFTGSFCVVLPQLGCFSRLTECLEKRHGKVASRRGRSQLWRIWTHSTSPPLPQLCLSWAAFSLTVEEQQIEMVQQNSQRNGMT